MLVRKTGMGTIVKSIMKITENTQLDISTMKGYSGNVSTHIQFETVNDDVTSFTLCGDFSKMILSEKIRATVKNLTAQHQRAIEIFKNSEDYKKFFPEA